ncbi:hypothetical protein VFPPC_17545 [Pochonia chlamydosporia 170]|uniref:Uncharacterized protein n=1 Tax=Pochonia chlamydosporia 170 TaxID=1380566 RepID=A0A219ARP5_METCM|nr:hypothetical protein VFPPC_17545 [Pochonia chlamydosporia 170]OWT43292.1 hypothetical protein VFPPC_17545 [Pochonia chlamydosporia 170]
MVPGGLVSTEWTEDSCSFFVFDQELRHLLGKRAYTTDGDVEYAPADWHGEGAYPDTHVNFYLFYFHLDAYHHPPPQNEPVTTNYNPDTRPSTRPRPPRPSSPPPRTDNPSHSHTDMTCTTGPSLHHTASHPNLRFQRPFETSALAHLPIALVPDGAGRRTVFVAVARIAP